MSEKKVENLILFIHGFTGSKKTWDRKDKKKSIKQILESDIDILRNFDLKLFRRIRQPFQIYFLRLNTGILFILRKKIEYRKNLPIEKLAKQLETEIKTIYKDYKNIILVAHSMGGLVAKKYIVERTANGNDPLTIKYISLAVPHDGTRIADIGSIFFKKNKHLRQLKFQNSFVSELNLKWVRSPRQMPDTWCFVADFDQIVTDGDWQVIKTLDTDYILNFQCDHSTILIPDKDGPLIFKIKEICELYINRGNEVHMGIQSTEVFAKGSSIKKGYVDKAPKGHSRRFYIDRAQTKLKDHCKEILRVHKFYPRTFHYKDFELTYLTFFEKIKNNELVVLSAIGGMGKTVIIHKVIQDLMELKERKKTNYIF